MPDSPNPRALKIQSRVEKILEGGDFPSLSRQIEELMAVLGDDNTSLEKLADITLRNYALTLKILRTANSFYYNRSGAQVLSVTRAIVLMGARTVRDLASAMIAFEHFQTKSPTLKHLMTLSMLTATHAREIAVRANFANPEEAYLCGMFRGLGEVLVAAHFPNEYAAILRFIHEEHITPLEASLRVLGLRFEDLGVDIAKRWGMPDVAEAMLATPGSSTLGNIVAFANALTNLVYRDDNPTSGASLLIRLDKHRQAVRLDRREVATVLDTSLDQTRETFQAMGLTLNDLRLRKQAAAAIESLAANPDGDISATDGSPELRIQLLDEVESSLTFDETFDLHRFLMLVLEAVRRGGPFDRTVLALVVDDGHVLRGKFGFGAGAVELSHRFTYRMVATAGHLPALVLAQHDEFLQQGTKLLTDAQIDFLTVTGAQSAAILPFAVNGHPMGCLYADRVEEGFAPDEQTRTYLEQLRLCVARAVQFTQAAGSS